jgi:hypothetical protein
MRLRRGWGYVKRWPKFNRSNVGRPLEKIDTKWGHVEAEVSLKDQNSADPTWGCVEFEVSVIWGCVEAEVSVKETKIQQIILQMVTLSFVCLLEVFSGTRESTCCIYCGLCDPCVTFPLQLVTHLLYTVWWPMWPTYWWPLCPMSTCCKWWPLCMSYACLLQMVTLVHDTCACPMPTCCKWWPLCMAYAYLL